MGDSQSLTETLDNFEEYVLALETMLKSTAAEAIGIPVSSHGLFVR